MKYQFELKHWYWYLFYAGLLVLAFNFFSIIKSVRNFLPNPYYESSLEYYDKKIEAKILIKDISRNSAFVTDQDSNFYAFYFMSEYDKKSFYEIADTGDSLFKNKMSRILCIKKSKSVKKICWEIKIPADFK